MLTTFEKSRGRCMSLCVIDIRVNNLTLPGINAQGFFLHPGNLPLSVTGTAVEVSCPEAFHGASPSVSVCPTVQPLAFSRIFRAAFWSRSMTRPQEGQICVRMLRLFLTRVPHPEQSWLLYCGATAMTGMPCRTA